MANGQTIHENGRVTILFKTLLSIAAALITTGILAMFAMTWTLNTSIAELDKTTTVLNNNIEHMGTDFKRVNDDIAGIKQRLSDIEGRSRRDRDDNRNQ